MNMLSKIWFRQKSASDRVPQQRNVRVSDASRRHEQEQEQDDAVRRRNEQFDMIFSGGLLWLIR